MPVVLPNVYFDTARSANLSGAGVTSSSSPYLVGVEGHISQMSEVDYRTLPEGALSSEYVLRLDESTDVRLYDRITNIRLRDNVTPWLSLGPNEYWSTLFVRHYAPGLLAYKACYLMRVTGGGTQGGMAS